MGNGVNIDRMRSLISERMDAKNIKAKRLSAIAGLNESAVRDLLGKVEDPRISTLMGIAKALGISESVLLHGRVPVIGSIRENGVIEPFIPNNDKLEMANRPPDARPDELRAYRVVGSAMRPAYQDGDLICISRASPDIHPMLWGRECIVSLADTGAVLLRRLHETNEPDRYNLSFFNADLISHVELSAAAPVLFVAKYDESA